MKLDDYLMRNETLTLYRVLSEPDKSPETKHETNRIAQEMSGLVDLSSSDLSVLYNEISVLLKEQGKYVIKHSKKSIYTWGTSIIDIVVVGLDEKKVNSVYESELKKATTNKTKLLEYMDAEVLPVLQEVFVLENVVLIGHRGCLTIPERKANPLTDIDIFIVVKESKTNQIIDLLKKIRGTVSVLNLVECLEAEEKTIKKNGTKIGFDLIPFKIFQKALETQQEGYFKQMFQHMQVLMDKR